MNFIPKRSIHYLSSGAIDGTDAGTWNGREIGREFVMRKTIFGALAALLIPWSGTALADVQYISGDFEGPIFATLSVELSGPLPPPNPFDGYFVTAEYIYFSDASGLNMGNYAIADATLNNGPSGPTYSLHSATAEGSDALRYLHTGIYFQHGAGESPGFGAIFSLELTIPAAVPEPSTWAMLLIGFAGIGFVTYREGKRASRGAAPWPTLTLGSSPVMSFAPHVLRRAKDQCLS
jgi:hypothetical protein